MKARNKISQGRRRLLRSMASLPGALVLGTSGFPLVTSSLRAATPSCELGGGATLARTAGPYFTPDSPLKADFTPDAPGGQRVLLAGRVLDRECRPLAGAVVDLWHANDHGEYDNQGYLLRGHQRGDGLGRYAFTTIRPGDYTFRTAHYHVRIAAPSRPVLTTQLFFPGSLRNAADFIHDSALEMATTETPQGLKASFDFIIDRHPA